MMKTRQVTPNIQLNRCELECRDDNVQRVFAGCGIEAEAAGFAGGGSHRCAALGYQRDLSSWDDRPGGIEDLPLNAGDSERSRHDAIDLRGGVASDDGK
jgi:hypothetical protein